MYFFLSNWVIWVLLQVYLFNRDILLSIYYILCTIRLQGIENFSAFISYMSESPLCVLVCSRAQSCWTLWDLKICSFLCPWDFPGKNTGMDCHIFLFQGILKPRDQIHVSCTGRWVLYH